MATALSIRQDLATVTAGVFPTWAVYAAPPEAINGPSIVIAPRVPYRRRSDYCAQEVQLRVTLLVPRTTGAAGLDLLDTACDTWVSNVADYYADVTWESVDEIGTTVEVGAIEYITAGINVVAYVR